MKYYSELTKKFYDAEQELLEDEERVEEEARKVEEEKQQLAAQRKARADEIEEARKRMIEAQKEYENLIHKFCEDFKSYHYSCSSFDELPHLFKYLFSNL